MYQADPTAAVAPLAAHLRPGGTMAFLEVDIPSAPGSAGPWPESELANQLGRLIWEVWNATGTQIRMGARLPSLFHAAGLDPSPDLVTEAMVGVGREWAIGFVALVRSMTPVIERFELADLADLDLDTAVDRLLADAPPPGPIGMGPAKVGAWARKPEG